MSECRSQMLGSEILIQLWAREVQKQIFLDSRISFSPLDYQTMGPEKGVVYACFFFGAQPNGLRTLCWRMFASLTNTFNGPNFWRLIHSVLFLLYLDSYIFGTSTFLVKNRAGNAQICYAQSKGNRSEEFRPVCEETAIFQIYYRGASFHGPSLDRQAANIQDGGE